MIVFHILHPDEIDFPFSRWSRFENLENFEHHMMLDPAAIRQSYLKVLAEWRQTLTEGLRKHEVDLIPMITDEPHAEALRKYLALRMRR